MLRIKKKKLQFARRGRRRESNPQMKTLFQRAALALTVLVVFPIAGYLLVKTPTAHIQTTPSSVTQPAAAVEPAEQDVSTVFDDYADELYSEETNTYSFKYSDYNTLFKNSSLADSGDGLKSGTISRNGQTWNIYCYSSLNSCSVSTSSGTYGNVSCYDTTNSCSYSDSDGNYANTYCYEYSNSCSTTGSDGYSANTYCYEYSNSCSTTDSNGGYSSTYCYEYSNSCSTSNSDGSTTNTYCYTYSNSCSSSTYGGSSSYDYSSRYNY